MELFIAFLLVVAASYLAFLSSKNEILKGKKISKSGWKFIASYLVIIILTISQVIYNKIESNNQEASAIIRQDKRDSSLRVSYDSALYVMKAKYDTSNWQTISTLTTTLGKYGFKLDSANQRLLKIVRDSAKTRIIMPEEPVLMLASEEGLVLEKSESGLYRFKIQLASMQAASTNFDLSISALVRDSAKRVLGYYSDFKKIRKDLIIPTELGYSFVLLIPTKNKEIPRHLDILIKGTYTNRDGSKSHQINSLYGYDFKNKVWGEIDGPTRELVLSTMEQLKKVK